MPNPQAEKRPPIGAVLVTGAGGFIGRRAVRGLVEAGVARRILALDLHPPAELASLPGVEALALDMRSPSLGRRLADAGVEVVLHLAAVVSPRPEQTRAELHDIEVGGTRRVVEACLEAGVRRLVYTSSGAAYGYHADNAPMLREDAPLRGNEDFAYSDHKRQIEEHLAEVRRAHPALEQVVFRVSTVLGPTVHNQITAMFERPVVVGVRGADTPFCFVHVDDVVGCLVRGALDGPPGVWNLTGDGVMTLREIAHACGRPYVALPPALLRKALTVLSSRGLVPYGPEQVAFLQHRPVLDNRRLIDAFGYRPRASRQVFADWRPRG